MASRSGLLARLASMVTSLCLALVVHTAAAEPATPAVLPGTPTPVANPVPDLRTPTYPPALRLIATVNQIEGSRFPYVVAYVTATDENSRPLNGLVAGDFELLEDSVAVVQHEVTETVNMQAALSVALVLDISGSMDGKSIDYARQAATSFMDVLGPRDSVELISFSSLVKTNVPFTTTKTIIAQGIANLRAGGDTALYDAVATAAQSLARLGPGRKIAVLLTDGEDTRSKTTLSDLLRQLAASRVPVFTVGLGSAVDRSVLDGIAKQSGGRAIYAPSPPDLATAYRVLSDQLRGQYAISFGSRLLADGNEHQLTVRLKRGTEAVEGGGTFVARQNPPWVDIVRPPAGASLSADSEVEVSAQPNSPAARISRVDFAIDGQLFGSREEAPFVAMAPTSRLTPGEHVLRVTAYDSAGNSTSPEVSFTVPPGSAPAPEIISQPTATPIPEPPPAEPPRSWLPAVAVLAATLGAGGGLCGVLVARRRRRDPFTCPLCGTVYAGREECPTCAMEVRRVLLRRMKEVLGIDPDDREDREG